MKIKKIKFHRHSCILIVFNALNTHTKKINLLIEAKNEKLPQFSSNKLFHFVN